jgi:hypothetical protein
LQSAPFCAKFLPCQKKRHRNQQQNRIRKQQRLKRGAPSTIYDSANGVLQIQNAIRST